MKQTGPLRDGPSWWRDRTEPIFTHGKGCRSLRLAAPRRRRRRFSRARNGAPLRSGSRRASLITARSARRPRARAAGLRPQESPRRQSTACFSSPSAPASSRPRHRSLREECDPIEREADTDDNVGPGCPGTSAARAPSVRSPPRPREPRAPCATRRARSDSPAIREVPASCVAGPRSRFTVASSTGSCGRLTQVRDALAADGAAQAPEPPTGSHSAWLPTDSRQIRGRAGGRRGRWLPRRARPPGPPRQQRPRGRAGRADANHPRAGAGAASGHPGPRASRPGRGRRRALRSGRSGRYARDSSPLSGSRWGG